MVGVVSLQLLESRLGPFSGRVWGLIVNLLANALALYGAARWLSGDGGAVLFVAGVLVTIGCIGVLSQPDRRRETGPRQEPGRDRGHRGQPGDSSGGNQQPGSRG